MNDSDHKIKMAIADFRVAISEFTTSLENTKEKVAKMKLPEACQCAHCKDYLERLEGQSIPLLNGQIAAIRGALHQLQDQIDG